jgi:uncharacterized SAM-binding protein YcdF (DUF218 family)
METWSYTWAVRNLIAELIMPPGIWLMWVLLILFLYKKNELVKKALIVFGLAMLWVTSTNYFAIQLTNLVGTYVIWSKPLKISDLEPTQSPSSLLDSKVVSSDQQKNQLEGKFQEQKLAHAQVDPQAIVILGSGRRLGALDLPEYQHQDISPTAMERVRLGARLAKQTKLPILVTGGAPDRVQLNEYSEAELMAKVLQDELQISAKWLEVQSNTTRENAQLSAAILKKEKIQEIYLVTHFWHMPRAKTFFEKEGFKVIEAPMGFYQKEQFNTLDFYPSSGAIQKIRWIWRESLGLLWAKLT